MVNEESKSDAVKEARALLAITHEGARFKERDLPNLINRQRMSLSTLCNEVERLQGERDGLDAAVTVQAESIIEFQSQLRVMKEAIEGLISTAEFALSTPGFVRGRDQLKNVIESARSAITPKGSEQ